MAWRFGLLGVVQVARALAGGPGLEAGMPPDGAYARALALEARGRHVEAIRQYAAAAVELRAAALSRAFAPPGRVRGWRAKISWQRGAAEELLEQEAYALVMPGAAVAHAGLARACHGKARSIRAFTGERADALSQRAHREYLVALRLDPGLAGARIGLAALLADAGRKREAVAEIVKVGLAREDPLLAYEVAAFHAAMGDLDAAFAYLARAAGRPSVQAAILFSNELDPLRGDPRFAALAARAAEGADE